MPAVPAFLFGIGAKVAAFFTISVGWAAGVAIGSTPLALTVADAPRVRLVRVARRLRARHRRGLAMRPPFQRPRPLPFERPRDTSTRVWGLIPAPLRCPRRISTFGERVAAAWESVLIGPLHSTQTCMVPIFPPGTTLWFDPRIAPQHLDYVLVAPSDATLQWLLDLSDEAGAEYAHAHPTLLDVWIKQLRIYHGRAYLVTNDGQLELGDNEILGVLVHAERQ